MAHFAEFPSRRNVFLTLIILCTICIFCMIGSTTFWQVKTYSPMIVQSDQNASQKCEPSFVTEMAKFDWQTFNHSVTAENYTGIKLIATKLYLNLIPFLTKHPAVPLNLSCRAPPLKIPHQNQNKCRKLAKPRKVGVLIQFAFEVDTLEIHFNELNDVVDKFFLIESIKPHNRYVKDKPLLWDSLKNDERFAAFAPKVVHFLMDDANLLYIEGREGVFAKERLQEKLRWIKFLEWNEATHFFNKSDILGFGDVDEVPYRDNIYYLKNCELEHDPIDIGIWFPYGSIDSAMSTDFPVKGHSFTLGDPTFWTLGKAMNHHKAHGKLPSRNRGRSAGYLLGGMHLSTYPYPPYQIAKQFTASEYGLEGLKMIIKAGAYYLQGNIRSAEKLLIPVTSSSRVLTLAHFMKNHKDARIIVRIPWLYKCNPRRYPAWKLKHDKRLD